MAIFVYIYIAGTCNCRGFIGVIEHIDIVVTRRALLRLMHHLQTVNELGLYVL